MRKYILIILLGTTLTSCTWVEPTPESKKVRLLSMDEVKSCKKIGQTIVSLKDKIAGFNRNQEKVQKELEILAQNAAVNLNGDTVVKASEVKDGKQTFQVYRCINA
ncbi:MAG: DUF4156 domain-containing protein [Gammaproteobacteria bacterium]|nr:DUF4156 domain-containing protein [Gammaproteobacteria bacterium]